MNNTTDIRLKDDSIPEVGMIIARTDHAHAQHTFLKIVKVNKKSLIVQSLASSTVFLDEKFNGRQRLFGVNYDSRQLQSFHVTPIEDMPFGTPHKLTINHSTTVKCDKVYYTPWNGEPVAAHQFSLDTWNGALCKIWKSLF